MENEKDQLLSRPPNASADGQEEAAGEPPAAASPEAPSDDLAAVCKKLREDKEALYDRLLRKQAELENFRKRTQREKEEFVQHATADLVRALLPTLDGFERALNHRNSVVPEPFYQGIELIYRELRDVLGRAGLSRVETVGKIFDPHVHQAVETVESVELRDQEIVEELQPGYKLKHRLLRPAIVKVAVAPRRESLAPPAGESARSAEPD